MGAWALGLMFAVGLAGSVYRIPIQVSDALENIQRAVASSSVLESFQNSLTRSSTTLRPLLEVRTKTLVETANRFGERYHLLFRGYHALLGAILILLFVWTTQTPTWREVAALGFALAVLTGMHTYAAMFREAYPVNHFLLIGIYALATYAIARARSGWLSDVAVTAILAVALLTLESGVVVYVVAVAAVLAGLSGISRWGLAGMSGVLLSYFVVRVFVLDIHAPGLGGASTGFGTAVLEPAEQLERFGKNPVPLHVYNVTMSALSVLLSQPSDGIWRVASAWQRDSLFPTYFVEMGSSILTTGLIAWYSLGRDSTGRRRWLDPPVLVFLAVWAATACLSLNYAEDEIISAAGIFYALAAGAAMNALLARTPRPPIHAAVAVALVGLTTAWAIRDVGLHYKLRWASFRARSEWAYVRPADYVAVNPRDRFPSILAHLRAEALSITSPAPAQMPVWGEAWLGEE